MWLLWLRVESATRAARQIEHLTYTWLLIPEGIFADARELRHHEDVLARVPIVYVPKPDIGSPPLELGPETACATSGWGAWGCREVPCGVVRHAR